MPQSPITSFVNPSLIVHTTLSEALKTLQSGEAAGEWLFSPVSWAGGDLGLVQALFPSLSRGSAYPPIKSSTSCFQLCFLMRTPRRLAPYRWSAQRVLLLGWGKSYQKVQRLGKHEAG